MPLTAIPALTRGYWSRNNIAFGANNTNTTQLNGFNMWACVMGLLNMFSTEGGAEGSTSVPTLGARAAPSIWNHRGSSDGAGAFTAIGAAGSTNAPNRWWNGGVFPGLVGAGAGTNHHWILIENVGIGLEMLFNFTQNSNSGYVCWSVGKSGAFSGGTATTQPAASAGAASFQAGQTGYSSTDGGQCPMWNDANFGSTFYGHLTVAANGEFHWSASRLGSNCFGFFGALWQTTGPQAGDVYNQFLLCAISPGVTGRGTPLQSFLNSAAFCAARSPNGAQKASGGILMPSAGGTIVVGGKGLDVLSGAYHVLKLEVIEDVPEYCKRGTFPDIFLTGLEAVNAPIPAAGAGQQRAVFGDMIAPCMVVQPLT